MTVIRISPDKALRFSNLYSRLLSQNVLSQKWAILYLLYQLSESDSPDELPRQGSFVLSRDAAPSVIADTFAQRGLQRLPLQDDSIPDRTAPKRPAASAKVGASETSILRDLPFALQGFASSTAAFGQNGALTLPSNLPVPIISLLHTLAEPCLLYRSLSAFVQSVEGGLVGQSLRFAIGENLRDYLALVATLEVEIRRTINTASEADHRKVGVTLKRCVVWTREATLGLRLMALIVEEAKNKKGGQLISMIHGFSTSHGDPFIRAFTERMLRHVTKPFYDMLRQWVFDGELSDPYTEFFVASTLR